MDDLKRILINAGILDDTKELIKEFTKKQKKGKKKIIKESAKKASVELKEDGSNYDEWVIKNKFSTYKENYEKYLKEYGERPVSDPAKVKDAAQLFGELSDFAPNDESSQKDALIKAASKYGVKPFEIKDYLKQVNEENYLKEKEYGERPASDPATVNDAAQLFGELSNMAPNDESSQKDALTKAASKYGVKPFEIEKHLGHRVGAKQEHINEEGEPSDVPTPTLDELKKKYKNIDPKVLDKELEMGIKEELEHTTSKAKAREVALDHLAEKPRYYTKLKKAMKENFKNTYLVGDRVQTPLGSGEIVNKVQKNDELYPVVKMDTYRDADGDTFSFSTFELKHLNETGGVGLNAEHNSYPYTPDIKKGTLKKSGKQMGFDITDTGIPPRISKDSINK